MATTEMRMKEIKESLERIDLGLRLYICGHRHLFNAAKYRRWVKLNHIEEPAETV